MTTIEKLLTITSNSPNLLKQAASELEALQKENVELRETIAINRDVVEIGMKWKRNSALEEWFPITAEELKVLQHDIIAYRAALGYSVPADHDGKLTNGETPQCGMCNSEYRKSLERDKDRLDWLENHIGYMVKVGGQSITGSRAAIDAAMQEKP